MFFFLCATFEVEHRKQCDFFPNTVCDISVSTWIWIYLTHSTLAWSRPRWCIFRNTFPAAQMMCVDTEYCLTPLEQCSPHWWVLLVTLHFSSWEKSQHVNMRQAMWRIKGQRIAAKIMIFYNDCIFLEDYTFSDTMVDISPKVYSLIKHTVLTVSDAVPSKCVSELTNCPPKSIFCASATASSYWRHSHRYCDLWFLLSAGSRCIMPLSRSTSGLQRGWKGFTHWWTVKLIFLSPH